jgi:glyoxylase-like metal-dependent hydrolase (beta-lactamase superfamily II)
MNFIPCQFIQIMRCFDFSGHPQGQNGFQFIFFRKIQQWTYFCYVIKDDDKSILIDTGVGNPQSTGIEASPQWQGRLLDRLKAVGIRPEDIDIVFHTHIHADHIGWNVIQEDGKRHKTFINAKYMAPRDDYEAYISSITADAIPEETFKNCVSELVDSGDMELVPSQDFKLTNNVNVCHSPGHVPGLMYVTVEGDGEVCMLVSDNFASPIQITDPDCKFLYDVDPDTAAASKKKILSQYEDKNKLLGACHFGLGKINTVNGVRVWEQL